MLRHLFFWPNLSTDGLRKELISTMKLGQGDVACSRKKTVLGWEIDTKEHHLRLTPKRELKMPVALNAIPSEAHQFSLTKWRHLLELLRSITPAISGEHGMFTRL